VFILKRLSVLYNDDDPEAGFMDHPHKMLQHDETVSHILILSLVIFTAFTTILLAGFF
jgi:hypothetical protein